MILLINYGLGQDNHQTVHLFPLLAVSFFSLLFASACFAHVPLCLHMNVFLECFYYAEVNNNNDIIFFFHANTSF